MDSSPERDLSPAPSNGAKLRKSSMKEGLNVGENYSKFKNCDLVRLIDKVHENPVLWDSTHPEYKDATYKRQLWWDLEKRLDFLRVNKGNNLKKIWTQLVGVYKEERSNMRQRSGSGTDDFESTFEFFEDLKFLDACYKQRIPEPLEPSSESVATRVSSFGSEDRSRSRHRFTSSRINRKSDSPKQLFAEQHAKLDKVVEFCMKNLNEDSNQPTEEHQMLFQKINDTMKLLTPAEKFDLTLKIGTMCSRVQEQKKSHLIDMAEFDEMS